MTAPSRRRISFVGALLALGLLAGRPRRPRPTRRGSRCSRSSCSTRACRARSRASIRPTRARLALIDRELRAGLAASGRFRIVDTAPAAAEIARAGYWRSCNGCEAAIAQRLGADLALAGWVQKVSNLILNINLTVRDAATRELLFAASVDIRGNTDESWRRGIRYLIEHRLLAE